MRISAILLALGVFIFVISFPSDAKGDVVVVYPPKAIVVAVGCVAILLVGLVSYGLLRSREAEISDLQFEKEEVIIELEADDAAISCVFYIANRSSKPYRGGFYFPIPVDENHPFPEKIRVSCQTGEKIRMPDFKTAENAIFFEAELEADATTLMQIDYTQQLFSPNIVYILTSANAWHHPIGDAIFRISHPNHWKNVRISYPFTSSEEINGRIQKIVHLRNLVPRKELEVQWDIEE